MLLSINHLLFIRLLCNYGFDCRIFSCDGDYDCVDGSDEMNCTTVVGCQPGEFQCSASRECIPDMWVCDGDTDCQDRSDEETSMCANRTCRPGQFRLVHTICQPDHLTSE